MKYLRSTTLVYNDIEIRKSEFVAKTQFLYLTRGLLDDLTSPGKKSSSLEYHWGPSLIEVPQIFIGDPKLFIGDPRFSLETQSLSSETLSFSLETPSYSWVPGFLVETTSLLSKTPRFSLLTTKAFHRRPLEFHWILWAFHWKYQAHQWRIFALDTPCAPILIWGFPTKC